MGRQHEAHTGEEGLCGGRGGWGGESQTGWSQRKASCVGEQREAGQLRAET
jgi:hypothetical protein